jgi:hypothetical protein
MPTADPIRVGELWIGTTTRHRWLVRITRASPTAVSFECVRGPGHARKGHHSLRRPTFLASYRRL